MKRVSLLLALHNHQPVGNFDSVFETAARKSYLPTLETWREFPGIPLTLHNSGVLWDWLELHRPEAVELVADLVRRGQVELLTGGYYEPILSAISDEDKTGQIRKLTGYLADRFGSAAHSAWLTERVWEPGLPRPLEQAGVHAVFVDDEHFHAAGVPHRELAGYFRTEEAGHAVSVFPILKELRYLVPFHPPEETIDFLSGWADESGERLAVLGDDGEKFGVWPETHQLVFEQGWLRRFLSLLEENREWLDVTTPARWMAAHPSRGLVYLPTASYSEMGEWALPAAAQLEFARARDAVGGSGAAFVRGGFWRNFLSKYAEGNRMHKRALDLSRRIRDLPEAQQERPLDLLWQAQCNCAYWHGVFGGLYLPHLRDAVYRRMIRCESELDAGRGFSLGARELDVVGHEGRIWFLRNEHLALGVAPEQGGTLVEWDDARTGHNLGNTLTRRREAYHERLRSGEGVESPDGAAASIHDRVRSKEPGLAAILAEDPFPRASFLDHLIAPGTTREDVRRGDYRALADLALRPCEAELDWDRGRISLLLTRNVDAEGAGAVEVLKRYTVLLDDRDFEVKYRITHRGDRALHAMLLVELNVTFLTGSAADRWAEFSGTPGRALMGEARDLGCAGELVLADEWLDLGIRVLAEPDCGAWVYPVETVSLSEDGFERNYQATCLGFHWPLQLQPGATRELSFECRHDTVAALAAVHPGSRRS